MSKNEKSDEKQAELLTHPSYEELLQKLEEAEQKAGECWDKLMRVQADADNAARRAERDIANAHKYALEKFIFELIPIVDSLELCVVNETKGIDSATDSVIEGVQLTLKMFYSAMEKFGIEQINPGGQPFDPEFQQAISMQEDPMVKPGMVISVLQKGYTLNKRLIRPALVTVASAKN